MNRSEAQKRGCERKRYFRTRALAEAAIHRLGITVHKCEFCDGWHRTTKRRSAR